MSDTIEKKAPKKFYFGQHNFDDPEDINEIEEQPEPTFSEAELEDARRKSAEEAYARGKQDGLNEAREGYEAKASAAAQELAQKLSPLLQQEIQRSKLYEEEAVNLSLAVFKKLFPVFQEKYGFEEFKATLESVLSAQYGQNKIVIRVPTHLVQGIEDRLGNILPHSADQPDWRIEGQDDLSTGAFQISWSDGGAVRDTDAIAAEIVRLMEEALARPPVNVHDSRVAPRETIEPHAADANLTASPVENDLSEAQAGDQTEEETADE